MLHLRDVHSSVELMVYLYFFVALCFCEVLIATSSIRDCLSAETLNNSSKEQQADSESQFIDCRTVSLLLLASLPFVIFGK